MRNIILIGLLASFTGLNAQTLPTGSFIDPRLSTGAAGGLKLTDSIFASRWSFTTYSAASSSVAFFNRGNATIFSVPVGMQLSYKLNKNFYAFSSVALAPAYTMFNRTFIANDFSKPGQNSFSSISGSTGLYSRAALGLQYVNDERTFSISGSIGIERNTYPILQNNSVNNPRTHNLIPVNR